MGNLKCSKGVEARNSILEQFPDRVFYNINDSLPTIDQYWRNVTARAEVFGISALQLERLGKRMYNEIANSPDNLHVSMPESLRIYCEKHHLN